MSALGWLGNILLTAARELRLGERLASLVERKLEGAGAGEQPKHSVPLPSSVVAEQQRQQRSAAHAFPPVTIEAGEPLPPPKPPPPKPRPRPPVKVPTPRPPPLPDPPAVPTPRPLPTSVRRGGSGSRGGGGPVHAPLKPPPAKRRPGA